MNFVSPVRLLGFAISAVLVGSASYADVGPAHTSWSLGTIYPQETVSGRSLRLFAEQLSSETQGGIAPRIRYRQRKSASQLIDEVKSGELDVADIFGGSLSRIDPLFELSTLPFLTQSLVDAKTLACIAEPAWRDALANAGLHLLVVSPWPPTGLWSRSPLRNAGDIDHLKIRTYDEASAAALDGVGAHAASLPMEQVSPLVREGDIDAVLSSGDGAVGDSLASILPNFAAVRYAFPVSFLVMSEHRFKALPVQRQQQLTSAAGDVQAAQWQALPQRIATNYAHMRSNGVSIVDPISPDLQAALEKEGRARAREWLARVGPDGQLIFNAYNHRAAAQTGTGCQPDAMEARDGDLG